MYTAIKATNTERIFNTIERVLLKRKINAIHAEARKYAFRTLDGVWHTADLDFVNDLSGLGNVNKNMLDD